MPYVAVESHEKSCFPEDEALYFSRHVPGGSCKIPASFSKSLVNEEQPRRQLCFRQNLKDGFKDVKGLHPITTARQESPCHGEGGGRLCAGGRGGLG